MTISVLRNVLLADLGVLDRLFDEKPGLPGIKLAPQWRQDRSSDVTIPLQRGHKSDIGM